MWRMAASGTSSAVSSAIAALALCASAGLLVAGVTLPILTVERFFFFTDTFSIVDAVGTLADEGEWLLAVVIGGFSVVFPVFKIIAAAGLWRMATGGGQVHVRAVRWLHTLGRWSMLDVLVAALVVVSAKASAIADASTEPGLYCFIAASVVLAGVTLWLEKAAELGDSGA